MFCNRLPDSEVGEVSVADKNAGWDLIKDPRRPNGRMWIRRDRNGRPMATWEVIRMRNIYTYDMAFNPQYSTVYNAMMDAKVKVERAEALAKAAKLAQPTASSGVPSLV